MRWIEAWSDLYEILGTQSELPCLLPSGEVVDVEACKGWLQERVYKGALISVVPGRVHGANGVLVHETSG